MSCTPCGVRVLRSSTGCIGIDGTPSWPSVRGPFGACILSLERLGWVPESLTSWGDDSGVKRDLTQYSPKLFSIVMHESTQRLLERRLAASSGHPSFEGRSACVDYVRRFVLSKVKPRTETIVVAAAATNAIWTLWRLHCAGYFIEDYKCPMCKRMVDTLHHRLWVCDHPEAVRLRKKAATQAIIDAAVAAPDSPLYNHAIFPHPVNIYPNPSGSADYVFVNVRGLDNDSGNFGWMEGEYESVNIPQPSFEEAREHDQKRGPAWHAGNKRMRMATADVHMPESAPQAVSAMLTAMAPLWIDEEVDESVSAIKVAIDLPDLESDTTGKGIPPAGWRMDGNLFADGHCSRTGIKGLDRASWAILELDDNGCPVAWVYGAVPRDLPQTPQAAEYLAAVYAAHFVQAPSILHDDCANVVRDMQPGRLEVVNERCAYAAVLAHANTAETRAFLTTVKVKAHVDHWGLSGDERWKAIGNGFADKFALAAEYSIHPQPTAELIQDITTDMNHVKATIRVMAAVLPLWGLESTKHTRIARTPGEVGVAVKVGSKELHVWELQGDRWICAVCRGFTLTNVLPKHRVRQRCYGLKDRLSASSSCQIGHCLVEVTSTTGRFTICSRCGGCGSRKAVKLACICSGKLQSRRAREAYNRVFKKGKHPRTNLPLTRSHYSACGNNVSPNQLRSEVDRSRRKRRLTAKTKPWVAAAFGIVEDAPPPGEGDDLQDEEDEQMDEDEYFQEEEDPFGFEDVAVVQLGGSSSSDCHASPPADPPPVPPPTPTTTPTDSLPSIEPAAKRACVGVGVTTDEPVVTDLAVAGSISVDPWAALQERKRRRETTIGSPLWKASSPD